MVDQISRETLQEKVYNSIKESIVTNELLPGEVLSIDSLSRELGVSPTPVREALTRLSTQGLVESARNKKAKVAPIEKEDVRQTYEVRKLLEPYACKLAAEHLEECSGVERELVDLKVRIENLQAKVESGEFTDNGYGDYFQVDFRLGEYVEEILGGTLLGSILKLIGEHSERLRYFAEESGDDVKEILMDNNREHLSIINALLDRNPDEAKSRVTEHLHHAEERTVTALEVA
ncbi:GntR family transcriptional regulator [Candidatus Bipolaricaulota bacterium]|nr:GntR family transcriptional regulator [Candidatus Bipolaricaulota bacterium]